MDGAPWNSGRNTPGHLWRWRAATVNGLAVVQVQVHGYFRIRAELRTTAPAIAGRPSDGGRPAINLRSTPAIADGGRNIGTGWGPIMDVCAVPSARDDMIYVLHVEIGNIPN
ncbi:hypothetical protein PTMSG1_07286 [Pyrenophora teres f. maculata]|nr:hypothetical protein PTMSG1_07286 [Pyrenophora teres f. maculata]